MFWPQCWATHDRNVETYTNATGVIFIWNIILNVQLRGKSWHTHETRSDFPSLWQTKNIIQLKWYFWMRYKGGLLLHVFHFMDFSGLLLFVLDFHKSPSLSPPPVNFYSILWLHFWVYMFFPLLNCGFYCTVKADKFI